MAFVWPDDRLLALLIDKDKTGQLNSYLCLEWERPYGE